MKQLRNRHEDSQTLVVVGTADEMKAILKSIRRAYNRWLTYWDYPYDDLPCFDSKNGYAIIFNEYIDEYEKIYHELSVKPVDMYLVEAVM